ncbi:MAG: hypothetical protein H6613_16455 [Ignavibacteriales bacterium]|nr:hypothetical protein [Ignavibacteriales bacterium]
MKDERVWITYKFEKCQDDEISNILYEKLIEEKLYANCYKSLLEDLLKRNFKPAIKHALKQVSLPLPNDELEYKKLLFGTSLLINYFIREAWVKVAKIIQKEYEFGKELFLSIAYERSQNKNFLKFMSSEDLSDLFIWLEEKFPRKEHKETEEAHFVGRREEIEYFKDNIIEELKQKGDNETELEIKKNTEKSSLNWIG